MKRIVMLIVILFVTTSSSVHALSWAYSFVVWKGNVYEVTDETVTEIGRNIGEVKRMADDMTGEYFGDASNMYPKGTKYYEIKGVSTKEAIAVEVKEKIYKKAMYQHPAPTHWMEYAGWSVGLLIIVFVLAWIVRSKKR